MFRTSLQSAKLLILLCIAIVLAAGGCSKSKGRLSLRGTITFAGQPLEGGWIYFRPVGPGPSTAGEIHDGEFSIAADQGLPPGTYQVAVESRQATGREVKIYTGEMINEEKQVIPARYNVQTTLQVEVRADSSNEFDFALETD